MLPSQVAPSQVHRLGGWLGNWSGDEIGMMLIRLKNDLGTLHPNCLTEEKQCPGSISSHRIL